MANDMHLLVSTPDGTRVDKMVNYAEFPLASGPYGILPKHASMMAEVIEGVGRYEVDGENHYVAVTPGLLSVIDNEVTVLVRAAEDAEDIDIARAKESERRARERLERRTADIDIQRAEASLARSLNRQKAYEKIHGNGR